MQYDLTSDFQRKAFLSRVDLLLEKGPVVEVTEKTFRSKNQNNYLHLLIGVVAMETGNTLEYCKEWYFKRLCNKDLFVTTRTDKFAGQVEVIRSSADLTQAEMSMAIDRFQRWGVENGIYMPQPGDESLLREIAIEMGRNKAFLGG
jgi:hypothetical protein